MSNIRQLRKDEARAFHDSGVWKAWTHEQIARFQMAQDRLCIPFGVFHDAIEKALGRSVRTHEFGLNYDGLQAELDGKVGKPSMQDILDLLPKEKTIVLVVDGETHQ